LNYFLEYISFFVNENEKICIAIHRIATKLDNRTTLVGT
jgi:hypothetical protein